MEFLLGILSGVVTSLLFWVWKNHISPPKIKFGEDISKIDYSDRRSGYLFIYKNTGHTRLIDLSIRAILSINGIVSWDTSLTQRFTVTTTADTRIILGNTNAVTTRLLLHKSSQVLDSNLIPENIKSTILNQQNDLESLLQLGNNATIQLIILGNDELTGIRKVFESKKYQLSDIKRGVFDREMLKVSSS